MRAVSSLSEAELFVQLQAALAQLLQAVKAHTPMKIQTFVMTVSLEYHSMRSRLQLSAQENGCEYKGTNFQTCGCFCRIVDQ